MSARERAHRVVIVGGGFGGLQAARRLRRADAEITLIDRRNFHLFQPLSYQIATGALSPGEVAYPLRAMFKRNRNARVLLAEVARFDLERRTVVLRSVGDLPEPEPVPYDTLIVAGGSHYSYFGHDEWSAHAAEVKSLESALTVRGRILSAFEAAELERDPQRRAEWLTFAVVGAGPTGVEMAGQIAELARDTLRSDFRTADPGSGRILLIEAADRVLTGFPPSLSAKAERSLRRLGVTPVLDSTVVDVDQTGVTIAHAHDATWRIPARTVVWAAGVTASRLATELAELTGADQDRAGRVTVEPDLTLPGHPEVFALGDMVRARGRDGSPVTFPGVAPVAMQQGRYAAQTVRARLKGRATPPFRYRDKGNLATIGRAAAVADIKGIKLSGFIAWVTWLIVHLFYLIGFQNRLLVLIRWSISFATRGRGPADHEPRERCCCRPSGSASRTRKHLVDAFNRGSPPLAEAMIGARKESVVFVELHTRQDARYTISLEWDRDTGKTQIVLADIRDASLLVFPIPGANAGDAFRHPFRYAP